MCSVWTSTCNPRNRGSAFAAGNGEDSRRKSARTAHTGRHCPNQRSGTDHSQESLSLELKRLFFRLAAMECELLPQPAALTATGYKVDSPELGGLLIEEFGYFRL